MITKQQYHRLMNEHQAHGNITVSALKADTSRPTARKYVGAGKSPAELQAKHTWRTRSDPVSGIWPQAQAMLEAAPELEAKAIFDHLLLKEQHCGEVQEQHLRTFQRRVLQWRLQKGPDKEVFFPQDRSPGQALQLDWTHASELGIHIGGQRYDHLLCHVVLPYSNWEWGTRCQSESLLSLRHGLQDGLQRLGKAPLELWVDHSSAATHQIASGLSERTFNQDFLSICEHYGVTPRTINVECPNENGDVESANGHLKRRLNQHLLLRGSREFSSEADYEGFLGGVLNQANARRAKAVAEELAVMRSLPPTRLSEYEEVYCPVSKYSTIRVKKVGYSVPARLIGQELKVEVSENQLQVYFGRELLFTVPRECGDRGVVLDYRHVIDHLLRKPGAFERYRYREELFLSPLFRQAYDQLIAKHGQRQGNLEYLRLLKLTSETNVMEVEMMLVEYTCPPYPAWSVEGLRQLLLPRASASIQLTELHPNCHCYDALLSSSQEVPHVQ
jgi:transposase InsO family protein